MPACCEHIIAIKLWNHAGRKTTKQQQQTAICLSEFDEEKRPPVFPRAHWQQSQVPQLFNSSVCRVSFRYHIVCPEMFSAVKEQLHNASSLWMGEKPFIQASCDLKKKKKKSQTGVLLCFTKAVLCWLQVQDSWAIRRGKMDNVLACVNKKSRRSLKSSP